VSEPPRILVVDDEPTNRDILAARLAGQGYQTLTAASGEEALAIVREQPPDLVLLDVMMPGLDGLQVCRRLKADRSLAFLPVILVTARADSADVVAGLEAGGDEYLTKPVDPAALVARVQSMLRIKALHDTVQEQAAHLETQAQQLAEANRTLEVRVQQQLAELDRLGRLRRFLAPQLAELIVSAEGEPLLESHRREIAVLFCELRGFTTFAELTEPETVVGVLREYHAALGALIFGFEGTVGQFAGDRLMVFFNDPLPCPAPAAQAVRMALAMRQELAELTAEWRKHGHELGFGVGIDLGYATLGTIGFEGRFDYAAIGSVVNLAARLCEEARDGQILVTQRAHATVDELVEASPLGELVLTGLVKPVRVLAVERVRTATSASGPPAGAPTRQGPDLLTEREWEVVQLIVRGYTNHAIAQELVIAEGTAVRHVANILNKLGLHSRAQVAVWAVERGRSSPT
jgi:DNA-binding NarL/FixJ family response regulator